MDPELTQQTYFLRQHGYPWLPYTVTASGGPADKAEPRPHVKPEPVVDETRPVRE